MLIKDHVQHRFKQKVSQSSKLHLVCLNTNRILFDGKFASCFCILSVFRRCGAGREIAIQSTLQRTHMQQVQMSKETKPSCRHEKHTGLLSLCTLS